MAQAAQRVRSRKLRRGGWRGLLAGLIGVAVLAASPEPVAADPPILSASERATMTRALAAAEERSFHFARRLAGEIRDPLALQVIRWLELVRGSDRFPFAVYRDFLNAHPSWPGANTLQIRAEEALDETSVPYPEIRAFFAGREPITRPGRVHLAQALLADGETARGTLLLREAWVDGGFSSREETSFLARHGTSIRAEDHLARLERLLWAGHTSAAERMLPRVEQGRRALAEARIRLQRRQPGVDGAINRVPAALRHDPGLVFDRIRWRREAGRDDGAVELLLEHAAGDMRPDLWWSERHRQARRLFREGRHREAYRLASTHGQSSGLPFAEAEWLSGWLALRFLDRPQDALAHFSRLWDGVGAPISLARAGYWAGRAAATLGNEELARNWYRRAAEHRIAFYGQLAADELESRGLTPPVAAAAPVPSATERELFRNREVVRAVRMLSEVGAVDIMRTFFLRMTADAGTLHDLALVADLAADLSRPDLMVRSGRLAAASGLVLEDAAFPIPGIRGLLYPANGVPDPAVLLSVARQESLFESTAISRAGARGVLQLMPNTARGVAQSLGMPYSESRLLTDPEYNARLGAHYLASQIERYNGDLALALAAYNAGPSRASAWIGDYGDPRRMDLHGRIDWMESIPFSETRNYVQRVLEGMRVYQDRLENGGARIVAFDGLDVPPLPPPQPRLKPRDAT